MIFTNYARGWNVIIFLLFVVLCAVFCLWQVVQGGKPVSRRRAAGRSSR